MGIMGKRGGDMKTIKERIEALGYMTGCDREREAAKLERSIKRSKNQTQVEKHVLLMLMHPSRNEGRDA